MEKQQKPIMMASWCLAQMDSSPTTISAQAVSGPAWSEVEVVFKKRCVTCHSAHPTQPGFLVAPLGMMMDTPEQVAAKKDSIYERTVVLKTMPIGNLTQITDEERALIGAWYEAGASTQ